MEKTDSEVINFVRFPLAVMVVMLHSYVAVQGFHISQVDYAHLTGTDIYSLVCITFSHVLTQVAVPMFFFISGYLFFLGFQKWDWRKYVKKLKRRIRTLLLPYISWNTFQALIIVGIMLLSYFVLGKPLNRIIIWFEEIGGLFGVYWSNQSSAIVKENMLGWSVLKSYPLLIPMWFIRDLMVTVLLTPLIWWLLKKVPYITFLIITFLYITGAGTPVPGLSFCALLFFAVGGGFSLRDMNFMYVCLRINKWFLTALFVILGITSIIYDGRSTNTGQMLLSLWICVALPFMFRIANWYMTRFPISSNKLSGLSNSTYFIFAFHGVIISYVYTALWKMLGVVRDGDLLDATYMNKHSITGIAAYLLTPAVTVAISVMLYVLVSKILKKKSWILTGK